MKVYIVTTGAYSDYKVRAVVSSEDTAKRMVEALKKEEDSPDWEDYREFELDAPFKE